MREPVHTAACWFLPVGVPTAVEVVVHESEPGEYRPPVLTPVALAASPVPPHTIISVPVQTALCRSRPVGAPTIEVATQLSEDGL
jgi:hypothetical protein